RCTGLPISPLRWLCAAGVAAALACLPQPASADDIVEPAVLSSSGGVLDILMVAKAKAVPTISFLPPGGGAAINPIGWVYEVCPRPASGNDCSPGPTTISDYGGVRLALQPGDVLKIRLINRLPPLDRAKVKHASEAGQSDLVRNPTNLHTHGLIVPARPPSTGDPTFGDYVFMQIFNSANGMPTETAHGHGSNKMDFADYRIDIPADHPSGVFWFHPHVHGISLNQVSAGMAGIITIGKAGDYVESSPTVVRHLILKDLQVLAARTVDYGQGPVSVRGGEVENQKINRFFEPGDHRGTVPP